MKEDASQQRRPVERMHDYDTFQAEDDGWRAVNGKDLKGNESPDVGPWVIEELRAEASCPYCDHAMLWATHTVGDFPEGGDCREWALGHCPNCAFWQFFGKHGLLNDFPSRVYWEAYISKARTFAESLPPGCEQELSLALRRDQSRWALLDPRRLETFVADILRSNFAPCQVTHLGRPFDGGVDVLFVDSEQHEWVVQVKRRTRPEGEPVETLRNLLGVMFVEDKLNGIVVSTADHFTHRARELQRKAAGKGRIIQLVDRGKLDLMLSSLIPIRPWDKLHDNYTGELAPGLFGHDVFRLLERRFPPLPRNLAHG